MSRLGKKPITVPEETKIKIDSDSIRVEGKKGSLSLIIPAGITVVRDGDYLKVSRANNLRHNRAMHGTIRQLIANMITGVNKEWQKKLEIIGTGYEVHLKGENLIFSLGFFLLSNVLSIKLIQCLMLLDQSNCLTNFWAFCPSSILFSGLE